MKNPPEDGGSYSNRLVSPPTRASSPKAVLPSSPVCVPAAAHPLPPPGSPAPSATLAPPKRRRGRPPRKTSLFASSLVPPRALAALQSPTNTGSTLLEAFPLPALDVVEPTVSTTDNGVGAVVVEEKREDVVATPKSGLPSPKLPSCKKDSLIFTPQRPPDSP
ncbi:hypothetical protein TSMEX_002833, partial [Taenia solium]